MAVQAQLKEGERLFPFLDDICVVCSPARVGEVYEILEKALREKTGINIPPGEDQVVEQGRHQAINDRCFDARSPGGEIRRCCVKRRLGTSQQGLKVLGVLSGHPLFITAQMAAKFKEQALLFERISPH